MPSYIKYRFLEHMTDALLESYGKNLEEAFENAGLALMDTMIHLENVNGVSEYFFKVNGSDLENLLYNWLETILHKFFIEGNVYSSFKINIKVDNKMFKLTSKASGESLDYMKHKPKVEVKSPTYHLMKIKKRSSGFILRFLLDL